MLNQLMTIDAGNAHIMGKEWELHQGEWRVVKTTNEVQLKNWDSPVIYSSVTSYQPQHTQAINCLDYFTQQHYLGMPVHYTKTLGIDRLVQAFYLFNTLAPCVLIDAGTFVTVDLITKQGFQGGLILPGLTIIAECYTKGKNLTAPSTQPQNYNEGLWPNSTKQALEYGSLHCFLSQIKTIVHHHDKTSNIIVTGGSAENLIKNQKIWLGLNQQLIHIDYLIHRSMVFTYEQLTKRKL